MSSLSSVLGLGLQEFEIPVCGVVVFVCGTLLCKFSAFVVKISVWFVAASIFITPFVSHVVYFPSAVFDPSDPLCFVPSGLVSQTNLVLACST